MPTVRVRVRGRHAYQWPMLRAVVREQVQVQFWLVLGFCFCSPQAARGKGVAHAGVLGGGGTGAGLAVENLLQNAPVLQL